MRSALRSRPTALLAGGCVLAISVAVTGCAGQGSSAPSLSPTKAVSEAGAHLDATSGIRASLVADGNPSGDSVLKSAEGVITTAPAFEGTASGSYKGIPASNIAVISVGGVFQINLGLGGWMKLDPASLCAPDPATLLDPDTGIANVLGSATGLQAGSATRGGPDNKEVLTPYTGSVPGSAMAKVLPCAATSTATKATFDIDADGYLRSTKLVGDFFGDGSTSTYTITIEDYDVKKDIEAP